MHMQCNSTMDPWVPRPSVDYSCSKPPAIFLTELDQAIQAFTFDSAPCWTGRLCKNASSRYVPCSQFCHLCIIYCCYYTTIVNGQICVGARGYLRIGSKALGLLILISFIGRSSRIRFEYEIIARQSFEFMLEGFISLCLLADCLLEQIRCYAI